MTDTAPRCRFCDAQLTHTFVDLGETPLANGYLAQSDLSCPEPRYPLHARVCSTCLLVQVDDVVPPEAIFAADYAYFSSYSASWVEHARQYADMARERFALGPDSLVVEIASNDGYLLQHFVAAGVPVLGVEPARGVAEAAVARGVPTEQAFFGHVYAQQLHQRGMAADLVVANNVLAHVPDLHHFLAGFPTLLKSAGVLTLEFPHLLRLIEGVQFDTIYHEHFSYFTLFVVERACAQHGLRVFDVEELPTHGGSLRVYATPAANALPTDDAALTRVRDAETLANLHTLAGYEQFQARVGEVKTNLLAFLHEARSAGKTVAAYGAAAKGNTLLNYCGIGPELLAYVVDRNPHKQGRYLPGSHLPIRAPEEIAATRPDYVLILPWNLTDEIRAQMAHIGDWGGCFVVAVPRIAILDPPST